VPLTVTVCWFGEARQNSRCAPIRKPAGSASMNSFGNELCDSHLAYASATATTSAGSPAIGNSRVQLRIGWRDYLACEPAQRHRDADIVRKLNCALAPFLLTATISPGKPVLSLQAAHRGPLAGLTAVVSQLYDGAANGTLSRLKMCASDECHRVFYDRSKPATRRWCLAGLCGNRVKTRAYRERQRA
jgi:predicted RNA-binding Zn ribbon-like protein